MEKMNFKQRAEERDQRAESYYSKDLNNLRKWYSKKADFFKKATYSISFFIIFAGAAITFISIFEGKPAQILTAFLGAAITICKGWERTANYNEKWRVYRFASGRMKRERRLYVNGVGDYDSLKGNDEDEIFKRFVENIDSIIKEEQNDYWQNKKEDSPANLSPKNPQ